MSTDWDPTFGPSYTPMEMLDLGVFEGIYTGVIKNIPKKYKEHPKVLPKGSEPDIKINKFGVKSRSSLKEWQRKGWTTELSPLGWWEWYIKYFEGRRDEKEDKYQIGRWKSFVARHNGQMRLSSSKWKQEDSHLKSKQGQLQWAWDFEQKPTPEQITKNAKRVAKAAGSKIPTKMSREIG